MLKVGYYQKVLTPISQKIYQITPLCTFSLGATLFEDWSHSEKPYENKLLLKKFKTFEYCTRQYTTI